MTTKLEKLQYLSAEAVAWDLLRGLDGSTAEAQLTKFKEEAQELVDDWFKARDEEKKLDAIGDMWKVLIAIGTTKAKGELKPILAMCEDIYDASNPESHAFTEYSEQELVNMIESLIKKDVNGHQLIMIETMRLMIAVAQHFGFDDLLKGFKMAVDEIKPRRGKLINGVFVKESDL